MAAKKKSAAGTVSSDRELETLLLHTSQFLKTKRVPLLKTVRQARRRPASVA